AARERLHRLKTQAGLEEEAVAMRETSLEEATRILRQDTTMYQRRAATKQSLGSKLQALQKGCGAAELSALRESREGHSLLILERRAQERRTLTEAACNRLRKEAEAMDSSLEGARDARKLLLGHVNHTVTKASTLLSLFM
ncbi:unnamed protein product, partial [Discosporangium mesarthrocarpum]